MAPANPPEGTTAAIITAWGGGQTDQSHKSLNVWGGGHTDYGGNEVYELRLDATVPAWVRLTNPSSTSGGSESSCQYGDGQPRSYHSWKMAAYADVTGDLWIPAMPGQYRSGANGGKVWRFNRATTSWQAVGDAPAASVVFNEGIADYDSMTGRIVVVPAQGPVYTVEATTGTITGRSANPSINYTMSGAIAASLRALVLFKSGGSSFRLVHLDTWAVSSPTVSGAGPPSGGAGLVWHEPSRAFLAWGQSANRAQLYKLTPPSNPFSGTWAWSTVSPASGNTVVPDQPAANGTNGRFGLIRNLGGAGVDALVLINRTGGATYVFKLPAGGV